MTEKQKEALKGILEVVNSLEGGLKDVKDTKEDIRARKTLEAIKKALKEVTRTSVTLEDRIQSKLKEL